MRHISKSHLHEKCCNSVAVSHTNPARNARLQSRENIAYIYTNQRPYRYYDHAETVASGGTVNLAESLSNNVSFCW